MLKALPPAATSTIKNQHSEIINQALLNNRPYVLWPAQKPWDRWPLAGISEFPSFLSAPPPKKTRT
jgi:hypothetical protein